MLSGNRRLRQDPVSDLMGLSAYGTSIAILVQAVRSGTKLNPRTPSEGNIKVGNCRAAIPCAPAAGS